MNNSSFFIKNLWKIKKKFGIFDVMSDIVKQKFLMRSVSVASISVALVLIILKTVAYFLTGSVSVLSSLFDSVQDFMTSFVNFIAVKRSLEPADKNHRFGHGKAESIGSLIQGMIIFSASLFLLKESLFRVFHEKPIDEVNVALGVTIFALFITIVLVRFQLYVVKRTQSLSIKADMAHYTGDILMNIGVLASVLCVHHFDLYIVDALFGVGVSFYLFIVVYKIMREAVSVLMDTEMSEEVRSNIEKKVLSYDSVYEIVDLKTRMSGQSPCIQFCVKMDPSLTLKEAHDVTELIENNIKEEFEDCQIIIHLEPSLKGGKNDIG